jgi:hypothetical protein
MICLQILGGHGACGHEAAEGSCVGIGRAGHGGQSHEICEEGGDCGEGAESDVEGGGARGARVVGVGLFMWSVGAWGVRPRRQQEGHCDGSSQPSEKKKKEKGVTVVTQTSLAN